MAQLCISASDFFRRDLERVSQSMTLQSREKKKKNLCQENHFVFPVWGN